MKKIRKGSTIEVFDDLKNRVRKAHVIGSIEHDSILGDTMEIEFLDNRMKNVAYWSLFRKCWSRLNIGGCRPVASKEKNSTEEALFE